MLSNNLQIRILLILVYKFYLSFTLYNIKKFIDAKNTIGIEIEKINDIVSVPPKT